MVSRSLNRFQTLLRSLPPLQTEESIALRVLVQVLVAVAIAATDVAAGTQTSWWAIPCSFLGGWWSWRQRHRRSLETQFAISIGMLVALGLFFGRLLESLGDTRLTLAELLVHLQVLHSFDLPRRKDLGYSMVIGLILLGVAATLSQTMAFAPLLVVALAIALPMLVLDYRSQLGLTNNSQGAAGQKGRRSPWKTILAPKQFLVLILAIALLGLAVFAVLPRFPGYQLRTFPVAAPPGLLDRDFDTDEDVGAIENPGYDEDGSGTGDGTGNGGQMDTTFYYGFSSRMNQNLVGELIPKTVLRVRSQAKGFWRVLAFDRYTGQGWEISRNDDRDLLNLDRPGWSYRFLLPPVEAAAGTREVIQSYTVVSTLPNLIPMMANARELYFPTREVVMDPERSLRSPRILDEGLTYSVISQVPIRNRTLLREAGTDYGRSIREHYLAVPPALRDRLEALSTSMLARTETPRESIYEQVLYLTQAVKQGYEIRADVTPLAPEQDLVEAFFFDRQGGYPDHFASALALLLRSRGIPARLAVGFAPGEFNPFTGLYEVKNTDAHAIVEVYFPNYGWYGFDPIPGHPLVPPSIEDNETFAALERLWAWIAGWLPAPLRSWLDGAIAAITAAAGAILGWLLAVVTGSWLGAIAGAILVVAIAWGGLLLWRWGRRWRYRRSLKKLDPIEALYRQTVDWLAIEVPRQPWQTPLEYAQAYGLNTSATGPEGLARSRFLTEVTGVYCGWRYGDRGPTPTEIKRLTERLMTLRRSRRPGRPSLARKSLARKF
ncbi:MAG: DUF3488 and DUF4129 domain-containing transglutaminase family protein [Cyanophyceae cyanobacterium]